MKRFYNNLPIETYVLLLPALLFLFTAFIYAFFQDAPYVKHFLIGYFHYSNILVEIIFPVIFVIISISAVVVLIMFKDSTDYSYIFRFVRSLLFVLSVLTLTLFALSIAIQFILNTADSVNTAVFSIIFTRLDYAIFGGYPWLYLHSFITAPWIGGFIYSSYFYLLIILPVFLVILFYKNTLLFRKLLLSFCMVTAMGIPFWIIFPALAPDLMYRVNIFNIPVESSISDALHKTSFSKNDEATLLGIENFWIDSTKESLPITSFPSMHAAWGVIVVMIGIELWAPLAIVLIPWLLASLIGTLFTLEHYAVDTIFGVFLGLLALYTSSRLIKFDQKRFSDKWDLFLSLSLSQEILKKGLDWVKMGVGRFIK